MRKITLYISTDFVGADCKIVVEVPDDTDEGELCDMAEDFLCKHIDYGWSEDIDEDEQVRER